MLRIKIRLKSTVFEIARGILRFNPMEIELLYFIILNLFSKRSENLAEVMQKCFGLSGLPISKRTIFMSDLAIDMVMFTVAR